MCTEPKARGCGEVASVPAATAGSASARRLRERSLATLADLYGGPPDPDELAQARRMLRVPPPPAAV